MSGLPVTLLEAMVVVVEEGGGDCSVLRTPEAGPGLRRSVGLLQAFKTKPKNISKAHLQNVLFIFRLGFKCRELQFNVSANVT